MMRKFIALLCFLAAGCSAVAVQLPSDGPQTANDLLALAQAHKMPQTLQGMARLDAYQKGERRSVDLIAILAKPASVQLQAVSPTLDMLGIMSTDGKRFVAFERGQGPCQVGAACPRNLARMLPIALPPDQLLQAMLGQPPVMQSEKQKLSWDSEHGLYQIDLGDDGGRRQVVYIEAKTYTFAGTALFEKGQKIASIVYAGRLSDGHTPKEMRVKNLAQDLDMSVQWRKVELDLPLDGETFLVQCPTGAQVIELSCDEQP